MPFLTRDLPPGGRHIDRTVPPAVPLAPAAARVRQLLPVGLLVAASSAGVALSPMLGGGTSAVADASHETASSRVPATVPDEDYLPASSTHLDRAAYVISRDVDRPAGKHRALTAETRPVAPVVASTSAGGKHRASGAAVETASATQQAAPKHSVATPAPATKTSPTTDAPPAATASDPASATPSSTPTTSTTQQTDVLTTTVGGVGQVVGGVLGTVGGLLGGN
ncbi:MAG: hypothetical protein ACXVDH_00655 [Nocardioides sp.]